MNCTNRSSNVFQLQITRFIVCYNTKKCKQHFFWFDVCFACDHDAYFNFVEIEHTFCRFELWMFYMRFLFSIEIFWNNQNFFICSVTEISRSVCLYVDVSIWKNIVIVIFASLIVDLKNHCDRDFRIANFVFFAIF